MRRIVFLLVVFVCLAAGVLAQDATQGSLFANDGKGRELGACPLRTTSVNAEISGFLARVNVRQEFENKFSTPIEAVYVFPLSQKGAVDSMTMTVGTRVIRGKIMRREEARQTYETAKNQGKTASLLDQERENVFTQSVANIMPGETVIVEISYVETLKYEDGAYEFVFPMTVGPRYIPGGVKDSARITPPVARTRAGHDISIDVDLNAGVPVEEIRSSSHQIDQVNRTPSQSRVTLRSSKVIPNKDFTLRYDVTGKRIEDAILVHRDVRGGFFSMILQPPDKVATEDRTPKEIVFVLDTSGSMDGFPIEKAKEAMRLSLDGLYPEDTFNLITFAGDTEVLFEKPVPATQANLEKAQAFLAGRSGGGGTEMMKAIKAALDPSDSQSHLRIVCFMTDAFIGNENEIIAEIQRHPNARVFSFGIGSSVNRMLLDKMAEAGNGEVEYVTLDDDGSKAAKRFYERVRTPLLTDLSIDWNGMPVADVYPGKLTDLFSAKPVVLHGRYTAPASGSIKLRGKLAGQPYERVISVNLPAAENDNDVLATLWARTRIDEVSMARLKASDNEKANALDKQIADIGLEFGLMTNFTSFVAVEDRVVNQNGTPVTLEVPVEQPAGTKSGDQYKNWVDKDVAYIVSGGGGGGGVAAQKSRSVSKGVLNRKGSGQGSGRGSGSGSGSGSGYGGGIGSGNGAGAASVSTNAAPPPKIVAAPQPATAGNVSATVEVTSGDAVVLQSSASQVSTNITTTKIENLPIQGRTFSSLLVLSPGTSSASLKGGFSVDGASGSESTFVIDDTEVTNFRTGPNVPVKSSISAELEGKALAIARPGYPAAAGVSKTVREVAVEIMVDSLGNVVSAKATGGNTALRSASEKAARLTRFAPILVDDKPVRLTGTLVYQFHSGQRIDIGVRAMKAIAPTESDLRLSAVSQKLHFWLSALVTRIDNGVSTAGTNEAKFVQNGLAAIRVEVTNASAETLQKLRLAGLVVSGQKGMLVDGTIDPRKLSGLATLAEVKLILPKI